MSAHEDAQRGWVQTGGFTLKSVMLTGTAAALIFSFVLSRVVIVTGMETLLVTLLKLKSPLVSKLNGVPAVWGVFVLRKSINFVDLIPLHVLQRVCRFSESFPPPR